MWLTDSFEAWSVVVASVLHVRSVFRRLALCAGEKLLVRHSVTNYGPVPLTNRTMVEAARLGYWIGPRIIFQSLSVRNLGVHIARLRVKQAECQVGESGYAPC